MQWFQLDHGNPGNIPTKELADVILGTYTFGHYICSCDKPEEAYQHLLREFRKISHTEDAEIIIAEVGSINHHDLAGDPRLGEYYACLTRDFGTPLSIPTDFQFENVQEAVRNFKSFLSVFAHNDRDAMAGVLRNIHLIENGHKHIISRATDTIEELFLRLSVWKSSVRQYLDPVAEYAEKQLGNSPVIMNDRVYNCFIY